MLWGIWESPWTARETPYQRSALCFSSALRYDLLSGGEKVVALAQARRAGRALVHGSVLERRPPEVFTQAVEAMLGERWQGDGLAGAGVAPPQVTLWRRVLVRLEATLKELASQPSRPDARDSTPDDDST